MKKQILLLMVAVGFVGVSTSCTSKKVDQENPEISEMTGDAGDAADLGETFGSDEEMGGTDDFAGEAAPDAMDSLEDPGAEAPATDIAADDGLEGFDSADAGTDAGGMDASGGGTDDLADLDGLDAAPTDSMSEPAPTDTAMSETPMADSSMADSGTSNYSYDETQGLSEEAPAPKPVIPLQKIISTPYKKAGVAVNALYVARPGDTIESVSQKIYGDDRSAQLKKINPTFARRKMKVGDKVYYNSPQRPNDMSQVLTYYEDVGLSPEIYVSQDGDNIRTVAKNLLGHESSWKEIWATNLDVESKGELDAGTRLRYWSADTSAPAPTMASNASPNSFTPPPPSEIPTPDSEMAPPPPMPDEVQAAAPATMEPPPVEQAPPPPPPVEVAPPPVVAQQPTGMDDMAGLTEDPDQMMALGAGAILLLAAIAMFIIIRKKRARRSSGIDFQTATNTQIE